MSWSFVHKEGNQVAHKLAHYSPMIIGRKVWLVKFISYINSLLTLDISMNII